MYSLMANFSSVSPMLMDSSQQEYGTRPDNDKQTPQVFKLKPL
jgi:hypothetical protein